MSMSRVSSIPKLAMTAVLLVACHEAPSSDVDGLRLPQRTEFDASTAVVTLSEGNVDEFVRFASRSGTAGIPFVRSELARVKGNVAVGNALMSYLLARWRLEGRVHSLVEPDYAAFVLLFFRQLQPEAAVPVLQARLDAVVSNDDADFGVRFLQVYAGSALACIATPQARSLAQEYARSHPTITVREEIAAALSRPACLYGEL